MGSAEKKTTKNSKLKTYMVFTKFRLSALVVVSALSGYLFVGGNDGLELTYERSSLTNWTNVGEGSLRSCDILLGCRNNNALPY